jgi:dinuclear metal center YbgI/SA1388 family protein
MTHRDKLIQYLNDYLKVNDVQDYGPQGLQVDGREEVSRIVTGVSASAQLFEEAANIGSDMVIVHHGVLWDRDSRVIKGALKKRLKILLANDISLLAYHLALDKHPELGNNALAAKGLKFENVQPLGDLAIQGKIAPIAFSDLLGKVQSLFQFDPLVFPYGPEKIQRVGYCSGGGDREISLAIDAGLDAYITGEAAESTMHLAKEGSIHFFAAGHYATERLGIRALGEHITKKFSLEVQFIDIPNPI